MTMWQLPENLVEEEILSRVPARSFKRLRSTCKRWNGLFDDRRFARNHFEKAAKQFMVVMLNKEFRICSLNVDLQGFPSAGFKGERSLLGSRSAQCDISQVFHCDGLLLCTIREEPRIVLWNPCTGQTKWIQPLDPYKEFDTYTLGSYEDNKSRSKSYKILRHGYDENERFEIFEINSNSWRTLDVTPDCYLISTRSRVSLKGKSYWFACDREDMCQSTFLVSFDYTTERFERLCLPYHCDLISNVSLCLTREEKLAVMRRCGKTSRIEIRVRSENGETKVVSWSKMLVMGVGHPQVDFFVDSSFLVDEEKKMAACCERWTGMGAGTKSKDLVYLVGEDSKAALVEFGSSTMRSCLPFLFHYVPSLVQIK